MKFTPEFREDMRARVLDLRCEEASFDEIAEVLGIARALVAKLYYQEPHWPKLVTRVYPNGSSRLVRFR